MIFNTCKATHLHRNVLLRLILKLGELTLNTSPRVHCLNRNDVDLGVLESNDLDGCPFFNIAEIRYAIV